MAHSYIATGDIYPLRFVKLATAADGKVTQAGAGERVIGISQRGTRRSPYIDSTNRAAAAGEPLQVYEQHEECALHVAGTVAPGDYLKSDADGKGVAAGTDADDVGAIALQAGVADDLIKVKVHIAERST
jgi:hypothetical protein